MAIGSVGSAASASSRSGVAPVGKIVGTTPQVGSATSTIVVSEISFTNPDGSTTTIITYADGHSDTETTPANAASAQGSGAAKSGRKAGGHAAPPAGGVPGASAQGKTAPTRTGSRPAAGTAVTGVNLLV